MLVAALFVAGSLLLVLLDTFFKNTSVKVAVSGPLRAAIILIIGIVIARVVDRFILRRIFATLTPRQRTVAGFSVRLLLYLGITLAVLAGLGVGLSSFLFGGAFLTVVLGLAGQSMLANLFGGTWLVLFQPFHVDDLISIVTWQYPLLMPSYPHEAIKPGYMGRVTDISLMYTTIITDDGESMVLPNGILGQAAIINKSRSAARRITVRFDIPLQIHPGSLKERVLEDLGTWDRPPTLELTDVGVANYVAKVTVWSRETEERARDRVLQSVWKVLVTINQEEESEKSGEPQEIL